VSDGKSVNMDIWGAVVFLTLGCFYAYSATGLLTWRLF